MPYEKKAAIGASLLLEDDSGEEPTFVTVPGVGDFGMPLPQVENEDVTTHDSPGRWREFVQTVRDGGEISIPLQFDWADEVHRTLVAASGEFGSLRFRIDAPDGTALVAFNAFAGVDGTGAFPVTGSVNATLNLRATGEVDLLFMDEGEGEG